MTLKNRKTQDWPPAHPDDSPEWGCIILLLVGIASWATLGWIIYTFF